MDAIRLSTESGRRDLGVLETVTFFPLCATSRIPRMVNTGTVHGASFLLKNVACGTSPRPRGCKKETVKERNLTPPVQRRRRQAKSTTIVRVFAGAFPSLLPGYHAPALLTQVDRVVIHNYVIGHHINHIRSFFLAERKGNRTKSPPSQRGFFFSVSFLLLLVVVSFIVPCTIFFLLPTSGRPKRKKEIRFKYNQN